MGGPRMIVELVGPPGAGKSSLLGAARRLLAERGIEAAEATAAVDRTLAESRVGRLAKPLLNRHARRSRTLLFDLPYAIRFAVVEWRVTAIAVHAIWRAPVGWDHRAVLLGRFLTVAARSHYLRSRLSERAAAVFDEGLLHRTVNLFAWRTGSGSEARRYLAAVPVPDLAIFVDAPDAVALARLEIRGLPLRLRGRSPATVNAFVVNACSIARSIPLLTAGRVDWIRVDNVADLAAAERALESGWGAAARPHL